MVVRIAAFLSLLLVNYVIHRNSNAIALDLIEEFCWHIATSPLAGCTQNAVYGCFDLVLFDDTVHIILVEFLSIELQKHCNIIPPDQVAR